MPVRPVTRDDSAAVLQLAEAFHVEDGFTTPGAQLAQHLHLHDYYQARGFRDEGRQLLTRPLARDGA
jgi:hypothetical protein